MRFWKGGARVALLAVLLSLAAAPLASGHTPRPHGRLTIDRRAAWQRAIIRHDGEVLRWLRHHPLRPRVLGAAAEVRVRATRTRVARYAATQRRWTRRELAETSRAISARDARRRALRRRELERRQQVERRAEISAAPAHDALWECIHGREGAWDAATGNGYYGGLQMTWGWGGYINGPASALSPEEQKQAAERGYRESGYSLAWLYGQWPNTAPPCAGYA